MIRDQLHFLLSNQKRNIDSCFCLSDYLDLIISLEKLDWLHEMRQRTDRPLSALKASDGAGGRAGCPKCLRDRPCRPREDDTVSTAIQGDR